MIKYSERGLVSGGPNLELYNKLFWTATSIFLLPLPHDNHGSQLEKGKFCPEDNLRQYVLRPVQAFQPVKILDKKLKKYSSKDLLRQFQYGLQFHPLLLRRQQYLIGTFSSSHIAVHRSHTNTSIISVSIMICIDRYGNM